MASGDTIHIQRCVPPAGIPSARSLRQWAEAARGKHRGEITLRLVTPDECQQLNRDWRGQDKPTNVLSFPMQEQGKTARAHWAHMVVHGVLHLLGHDHIQDDEALIMENLERKLLARLGFSDPYETLAD